jgi:PAS domain S-box-containing protein
MSEAGQYKHDRTYLRLVFAAALVAGGLLLHLALKVWFGISLPYFITFYPAVMVAALFSGFWYGLFSTVLTVLLVDYFIMPPVGSFSVNNTSDVVALALFSGIGIFMSAVAERYRRYHARVHDLEREQTKRKSEEQFRLLADTIPQLCWFADADGYARWCNQRWYEYTGTTPAQMEGWGWQSVHDPLTLPTVLRGWKRSIATGEPFDMIFPLRGVDGVFRSFLTRVMPMKDAEGKVLRWFGTSTDISDQIRAQQALRESEQRFRTLVESASDAFFVHDDEGRLIDANDEACRSVGYTREELLRMNVLDVEQDFDLATAKREWERMRPGSTRKVQGHHRHKNGTIFPIEAHLSVCEIAGERRHLALVRDTSERQQAEEALRVSQQRLALAVKIANMGEWELDLVNNSGSRSSRHMEIFGYPTDDTPAWNFERFLQHILPECREDMRRHLELRLASAGDFEFETQIKRVDGEMRWIWSRGRCEADSSGKPLRAFGIVIDITERKLAEQALLRSEKLASAGHMAASVAHEINNPLEAVGNLLFLARNLEDMPAQAQRYLEMADAELRRIAHITRQSLGFYRETSFPAPTAVAAVMESAIELLDSRIKKKHAMIEKQWNGESKLVAVAGELRQVFSNLLANSLDAIASKGTIKIRIANGKVPTTGEPCVRITIADNGRGIPKALRKHLFEPFFTTKGSTGTGLGLWVSKQIVDKHEGTIRMRSLPTGPRRGTAFSIVLPIRTINRAANQSN